LDVRVPGPLVSLTFIFQYFHLFLILFSEKCPQLHILILLTELLILSSKTFLSSKRSD
jgi:hypothetical protein